MHVSRQRDGVLGVQRHGRRGVLGAVIRAGGVCIAALPAAALVWAEPARVGCGPGQAGCGPAAVTSVTTSTTSVTSKTLAGAGPSWVSGMLAAWMLDETSGPRVNAQGTTTRDLS